MAAASRRCPSFPGKCHGKTADGRHFGGPSLISDKTAAASVEDVRNIIANGKRHMPKYTGKEHPMKSTVLSSKSGRRTGNRRGAHVIFLDVSGRGELVMMFYSALNNQ
ncbi:MAG TPA: cytochrome c [Verrucomicrobiae bacterium]|nr:cytochrome c [Verrucomicrobiae bacterium]